MKRLLSKSQIGLFKECPWKWKRKYIDFAQLKSSPQQERGSRLHKEVENFYKNIDIEIKDGKPIIKPKKDLSEIKNFVEFESKRIERCIKNGKFDESLFKPLYQELSLANPKIGLKGVIDAVFLNEDGKLIVIDWKSGKYNPYGFWRYRFELALYKELFEKSVDCKYKVGYWGIYFIDANKLIFEEINQDEIKKMWEEVNKVRERITYSMKNNSYYKRRNNCKWCEFREECEKDV